MITYAAKFSVSEMAMNILSICTEDELEGNEGQKRKEALKKKIRLAGRFSKAFSVMRYVATLALSRRALITFYIHYIRSLVKIEYSPLTTSLVLSVLVLILPAIRNFIAEC